MGEMIELRAEDGHRLGAYRAMPARSTLAGVVVIQEVFGITPHIRAVCDDFAAAGYAAVAPALFDRIEPGTELAYDAAGLARGRTLRTDLGWNDPLLDVAAALSALDACARVGVVGYCWGGSVAWLCATRLDVDCAVAYYGGQIVLFKDEHPLCPVLLQFGESDVIVSADDVAQIRAANPGVPVCMYPAGHGFNCTDRADYDESSATLARRRTLDFLAAHVA